uniref:Uncharacterized protein n=1 Tax=Anas platyrhynchos TaxID=8839 RepID=A0A8B9TUQ7_ANAPL
PSQSPSLVLVSLILTSAGGTGAGVGLVTLATKQRLHRGVLRDLERQHQKKENIRLLEEQIALTKQLKEERDKMLMEKSSQQS